MSYAIESWFERDRSYVGLHFADDSGQPDTNEPAIVEWWDEDCLQAIEDGFLDSRDLLSSAIDYARHVGLIHEEQCANCGAIHNPNHPDASNSGPQSDDGLCCYYCPECTAEMRLDLDL